MLAKLCYNIYFAIICMFVLSVALEKYDMSFVSTLYAASKGGGFSKIAKTLSKLDKAVSKVEKKLSAGKNADLKIKYFVKTLNIAKENFPSDDFSSYDKKLASFKSQAVNSTQNKSAKGNNVAITSSHGMSAKEKKKFQKAIKKINKAIAKVEDSLSDGKKADSRIRYLEKTITDTHAKYPGQDLTSYEQKLSEFKASGNLASQQKDIDLFEHDFNMEMQLGRPEKAKQALSQIKNKYPKLDTHQYESKINVLSKQNAQHQNAQMLQVFIQKVESLESYFADDKDYYFSSIETSFSNMNKIIDDFKIANSSIDIKTYEERVVNLRKQVTAKIASLGDSLRTKKADQGMTSSVHNTYVEQIVFSNKPIVLGGENPSSFIKEYTLGDPLFFRVYLRESTVNTFSANTKQVENGKQFALKGSSQLSMTLSLPDSKNGLSRTNASNGFGSYTTWGGELFNDKDMSKVKRRYDDNAILKFKSNIYKSFLTQVLESRTASDTSMKMQVILSLTDPQKSNNAQIVISQGALNLAINNNSLAKSVTMKGMCLAKATMSDSKLESEMLKSARHFKDDFSFVNDVAIRSKSWLIVRHPLSGEMMERRMPAQFLVKDSNNKKCYSYQSTMAQQHLGDNQWAKFYVKEGRYDGRSFSSYKAQVSCRCLDQ